ncbi:MAG: site-specific integrase [Bacteroidetes bacterium]|nr:site-specific integrase [Bacteroidota bacterium]
MRVTHGLWLDTRRKLKNGKYPLKVKVTYQRVTKLLQPPVTPFDPLEFTIEEWEVLTKGHPRGERMRDIKNEVIKIQAKLAEVINSIPNFSFEAFEVRLNSRKSMANGIDIQGLLREKSAICREQGRISTSQLAATIAKSLDDFNNGQKLSLKSINPALLRKYENWLLNKQVSRATVGIYTREMRTIFNHAIKSGDFPSELYPFGEGKYQPPTGQKIKQALSIDDIRAIAAYPANEENKEAYCRDLWLFCYLCNGMNLKDAAHLKYKNMTGNRLHFVREKTKLTNRMEKKLMVPLTKPVLEIMQRWGNQPPKAESFIFPILEAGDTPEDVRRKVSNMNGLVTDSMRRIAKALELNVQNITANSARDAFATISEHQGRPLSDISQSLGHSSISVTQHYLASFSDDEKYKWQERLL